MQFERLPIGKGLRIEFRGPTPVAVGAAMEDAVGRVSLWIRANPAHARIEDAKQWLEAAEELQEKERLQTAVDKQLAPTYKFIDSKLPKSAEDMKAALRDAIVEEKRKGRL
jgi:hypothetical protein